MEIKEFSKLINSNNLEKNFEAIKSALDIYYNNENIDEYIEVFDSALENNLKLAYIVEEFGNPFLDGEVDMYLSKEECIKTFEYFNAGRNISQIEEILLDKLKNENFFDIVSASHIQSSECVFNEFSLDVVSDFTADDIKAINYILKKDFEFNFDKKNLNSVIKSTAEIISNGNYTLEQSMSYVVSCASIVNKLDQGVELDNAYKEILKDKELNGYYNMKALEKINSKITGTAPKFNYTELALKKTSLKYDREIDELDDDYEDKPKSRMKVKM